MGFDPRRWRPSPGSRPLTSNVEALLAENEALRREVRSLRLQLEAFLQGEPVASRSREPVGAPAWAEASSPSRSGHPWSSARRARAGRSPWSTPGAEGPGAQKVGARSTGVHEAAPDAFRTPSAEAPRSRVTVGSSHGLSADLLERWGQAMARHPRWQELRIGPPGGLRDLEAELRSHWWNPALSLEQELDRRSPGLGAELAEALRGPHCRWRSAVRTAFALHGPRTPEWLSEEPLRVVDDLLKRVEQLKGRAGTGPDRRGTRTANHSGAAPGGEDQRAHRSQDGPRQASGGSRQAESGSRNTGRQQSGSGSGQRRSSGDRGSGTRSASGGAARDPRAQALALLGLQEGASAAAIKRAYRRLAKAHHPDLGGDAEAFRRLDAAYRSLL